MKSQDTSTSYQTRVTQHLSRKARIAAAEARWHTRQSRTDEQQLAHLQARGAGDCQEAAILEQRIYEANFKSTLIEALEAPLPEVPVKKTRGVRKRRNKPASLM